MFSLTTSDTSQTQTHDLEHTLKSAWMACCLNGLLCFTIIRHNDFALICKSICHTMASSKWQPLCGNLHSAEWHQWEERGPSVPVYRLARPWGARVPHSIPGLPQKGEGLQPPRCRPCDRPLQVSGDHVKHPTLLCLWEISRGLFYTQFSDFRSILLGWD